MDPYDGPKKSAKKEEENAVVEEQLIAPQQHHSELSWKLRQDREQGYKK